MRDELPEGWTVASLGDVSRRITKGATPTSSGFKFQEKGIAFVKVENIRNGRIDHSSIRDRISEEAHKAQARSILEPGDILFSIAGTIGNTCGLTLEDLPANTNQALAIIRGTSEILDARYLQRVLSHVVTSKASEERARGVGMNNISLADVAGLQIPIPPIAEQRRIVAEAAALLEQVNRVKARLTRVQAILKRFRQAILAAACSGRLTAEWRERNPGSSAAEAVNILFTSRAGLYERACIMARKKGFRRPTRPKNLERTPLTTTVGDVPEGWTCVAFNDVCDEITVGHVGPMTQEYVEDGIPFLRSLNVRPFRFEPTGLKFIRRDFHERLKKSALQAGDMVVVRSGNAGVACVIPENIVEANCADLIVVPEFCTTAAIFECG